MRIPYLLGALLALPVLPIMYIQAKKIRAAVPELPEAVGVKGVAGEGDRALNLITIGESTIAGVGADTHENAFTGSLAKSLADQTGFRVNWRVYARSGYTAKRVVHKILPRIKEDELDLIIIGLGGNDAFTLNRPWRWKADIKTLIASIRKRYPDTPVFFLNMPPIHEFPAFSWLIKRVVGGLVRTLGRNLGELVKNYENVYYSSETIVLRTWQQRYEVSGSVDDFFSDGVHPAVITYQVWGRDMAAYVFSKLKEAESSKSDD